MLGMLRSLLARGRLPGSGGARVRRPAGHELGVSNGRVPSDPTSREGLDEPGRAVVDEYYVELAKVTIVRRGDGRYLYEVQEPALSKEVLDAAALLLNEVVHHEKPDDGVLVSALRKLGLYEELIGKLSELKYAVNRMLSGYGRIYPVVHDPYVEEIAIEGPGRNVSVFHRRFAIGWMDTNIVLSESELDSLVLTLARRSGRHISRLTPLAEGSTPEGHRIALTYSNEVSPHGSSFVIRKYSVNPITMLDLIRNGTLTPLAASYLWLLVENFAFILVIGGMASGKTTMLQALLTLIPPFYRVVTIEDAPELVLPHKRWDSLTTRYSFMPGTRGSARDIDIFTLAKFALRRRAEYVVIGEVRGEEARILVQAAASGQGSACTFHADSAESAIIRLMSEPISVKQAFLQLIWSIVQMRRVRVNGIMVRRVSEITEVVPRPNSIELVKVFELDHRLRALEPNDPDELVRVSWRLKRLAETNGMGLDDLASALELRSRFLRELAENGNVGWREFLKAVEQFYYDKLREAEGCGEEERASEG